MFRVLITDGMEETALQQLRQLGFEVTEQSVPAGELGAVMSQYDALLVRSATKVRSCHIEEARGSRLKLILRCGVGVDNIDVAAAEAAGIAVRNTPKAASESVAELALGHLLSCCRSISAAGHTMREDKWEKKAYAGGIELWGKTLGIIGFGRIGQALGRIAKALGMTVLAYDLYPDPTLEAEMAMHYVPLEELLARSDFLSVHAPAADGQPLVRAETIAQMKDGVVIINTSRGSNVKEDDLLEALNSGKVRAAGLDVYAAEPSPNHDLYSHPHVSCTPHIGAQTAEAQARVGAEAVEVMKTFFGL